MSVVGIDFGSQSTKIGVVRNKGVDIVRWCPFLISDLIISLDIVLSIR